MENNKTPSIRFKGFTDPWEQRKVSEVSEIVAGGTPSTSVSEYWEPKEVPWLSSGEVHKKYITYTDDMISKNGLANSSAKIIKKNSVLIALAGQGKTRGTVAINRISLSTNQSIAAMSFNDDIVPEFVFSNLENRYDEIRAMSSGDGSRGGLNKQLVGDITIPYTIKEEQQKIGQYFSNLDHLITLHQRKYNKLLNVKKSMLEKMFPKNGSNIPEIRFKGFTDPWEQRKVLDLLELLTDYDANGSFADMAKNINTTDGDGYAWYVRITDLENPKPLSELKYVDESSYEFLKKTELHGGELLMAKRGNIGKVYIFEPRTKYATVAPNMYLLKLNNIVIPHFLYDYFVSEEGNKKLTRLNASSTMGALYKDDVKNIDVIMPSIEEQAMIGNFFQSIDHIITLHQRELEKLQNIKKSMLEKMFV